MRYLNVVDFQDIAAARAMTRPWLPSVIWRTRSARSSKLIMASMAGLIVEPCRITNASRG
jgi:hypothetical protein